MIRGNDPILLTPGPLTTSLRTKQAMLNDWGSWDAAFNSITASIRRDAVEIVSGGADYTCVPLQGSGTFSVEAAIGTLVPRDGKVLVPNNGAYCARIVRICKYLNRAVVDLAVPEDQPTTGAIVEAALVADPSITHVAQVHCETGAGILNDLAGVAQACRKHNKGLIVDAMSSFAALPIDVRNIPFDALVAASGKCLEGVPGMGFVIVEEVAAREPRRQRTFAGDGSARSICVHGKDDAVALHAADARCRRIACRDRSIQGRGRSARAARALLKQLRSIDRRHGEAWLQAVPRVGGAGADHRHVSCASRSGVHVQDVLRNDARPRVHLVSGQTDSSRNVSGRMHRCNRCERDAQCRQCGRTNIESDGNQAGCACYSAQSRRSSAT